MDESGDKSQEAAARAESRRLQREAQRLLRQAWELERQAQGDRGLACPRCGCRHLETVDSRPAAGGLRRRRRVCRNCGKLIRTTEIAESL